MTTSCGSERQRPAAAALRRVRGQGSEPRGRAGDRRALVGRHPLKHGREQLMAPRDDPRDQVTAGAGDLHRYDRAAPCVAAAREEPGRLEPVGQPRYRRRRDPGGLGQP